MNTSADGADKPLGCEFRREKCTRQERQVLATLAALALISTVCRSFPKISSALSAKVCGRSRSAKIIDKRVREGRGSLRDGGPCPCRGGGRHPAQRLRAGDTVETKRAAHRFSAIKMRSLNDPHQGSLPTVQTVKPLSRRRATPVSRCRPMIRHHPPANSDSRSTG
jgi:hypothetical protein